MQSIKTNFIPDNYINIKKINNINLFTSIKSTSEENLFYEKIVSKVASIIKDSLYPFPEINVDFCFYSSLSDSKLGTGMNLPATVFMLPFCSKKSAVIIGHSPKLDKRNAILNRIDRHILHEFVHLMNWKLTGSRKTLGDDNKYVKLTSWLDEGIAEVISFKLLDRNNEIDKAVNVIKDIGEIYTPKEVTDFLNDFESTKRIYAFNISITVVANLLNKYSYIELIDLVINQEIDKINNDFNDVLRAIIK